MVDGGNSARIAAAIGLLCVATGCSEDGGDPAPGNGAFGNNQPSPATAGVSGMAMVPVAGQLPIAGAAGANVPPPTAGSNVPPPTAGAGGAAGVPSTMPMAGAMPTTPEPTAGTGPMDTPVDPPVTDPPQVDRILPPVDSVDGDGPFEVTIDMNAGNNWVWHPTDLGADGLEHPLFIWGTGATAVPSAYVDHFNQMASHGFVIVAPTPAFLSASNMKDALDWILAENDSMGSTYYQKIDPERIAMGGHSQGSTSTFDQEAMESRLKTTIHIAGGSFDGAGSSKVKTPTAYICGDTDIARENCERDFANVGDQPTFFSILTGVDHVQCARSALPGMTAWLRWHLAGETERAAQFTGPDGEFHQGMWVSDTANWNW